MEFFCEIDCNIYQQYFKNPGRGWHGRTIELEPALGGRKGSHRAPDPSPPQRADSNGRSEEVARVLEGSKIDVLLRMTHQWIFSNIFYYTWDTVRVRRSAGATPAPGPQSHPGCSSWACHGR